MANVASQGTGNFNFKMTAGTSAQKQWCSRYQPLDI
jgi:hypothetical protein